MAVSWCGNSSMVRATTDTCEPNEPKMWANSAPM